MTVSTRDGFYTTQKISENREITPEGFLLCKGVAVARTGVQKYLPEELGMEPGVDGTVTVTRAEDEVFHANTLASFEGKSVTILHPYDMDGVTPRNYSVFNKGSMLNVRRGNGEESDLLLADLLIMDQEAIDAVQSKKYTEVSCGYDCDYVQDAPGCASQRNIIGNHVALVENGRAGSRCSIKDHDTRSNNMAARKPVGLMSRILKAFHTRDEKALDAAMEELNKDSDNRNADKDGEDYPRHSNDESAESEIKKAYDSLSKRLDAMSEKLEKLEEEKNTTKDGDFEDDPEDMTSDTILEAEKAGKFDNGKNPLTGDSISETLSRAELLVPGFKVQTTDAATTYGRLIKLRQKVLDTALQNDETKSYVSTFVPTGKTIDALTAREINAAFIAASEVVKQLNNAGIKKSVSGKTVDVGGKHVSIAEINKANANFWKKS